MNGNLSAEQDGPFAEEERNGGVEVKQAGNGAYYAEGAWGLDENGAMGGNNRREYRWDERNRLSESADARYSVKYAYGPDGERTNKYAVSRAGGGESETLYFNRMWNWRYDGLLSDRTGTNSKHIFLGDTRILTKVVSADGSFIPAAEGVRQYYYHSDHLGSAQLITDYRGEEYERLEYTPYGELWIEKVSAVSVLDIPYRFTGKERDNETGLYYYGARYLDSKTSRWLSGDPAMGEYVTSAPVNDGARKRNKNLPGMGGVFNYVNLHVYHYAGNNPVKYVDPNGRELWIDGNEEEKRNVLNMINSLSKDQYRLQGSYLEKIEGKVNRNGSETYSEAINNLINNGVTSIKISDYDLDNEPMTNPGVTQPIMIEGELISVRVTITGQDHKLKPSNNSYLTEVPSKDILMHELAGHAEAYIMNKDGNAIDIENKIRGEIYQNKFSYRTGLFKNNFKFREPNEQHSSRYIGK
jgi:RHS repeat-associated protein